MRSVGTFFATLLVAGFLACVLVRIAPGFDSDERELDSRRGAAGIEEIRRGREGQSNILAFYFRFLLNAVEGKPGQAESLDQPVTALIAGRAPVTIKLGFFGLLGAWALAIAAVVPVALRRRRYYSGFTSTLSSLTLSVPAALVALGCLWAGFGGATALAIVLFPRIFSYLANTIPELRARPHVIAARARGASTHTQIWNHMIRTSAPQLLSLGAASACMALGAAIPVEVLTDTPGLGQLAWQAAMARDLPLLVTLTWIIAAFTVGVNQAADFAV